MKTTSQENLDALADAETLRLFAATACHDLHAQVFPDNVNRLAYQLDQTAVCLCEDCREYGLPFFAVAAAHAAFLAVPGLREE